MTSHLSLKAAAIAAIGLSIPAIVGAQEPTVPAINGAKIAQLEAPGPQGLDRSAFERQQAAARALDKARESMKAAPPAPAASVPVLGVPQAPNVATPLVTTAPAPVRSVTKQRRSTPAAPTEADVDALERKLATLRSQVRVERAIEQGTVRADRASYVRARVVFPYTDQSIFEIHTSPDRMTTIELQPGEKITTSDGMPKAADTVNWIVSTVESGDGANKVVSVLVKPTDAGQETNLLIPTNRRSYYIVLRADSQAYMPMVGFNYPFDQAKAEQARVRVQEAEETRKETVSVSPEQIRFGYSIKGSEVAWRPVRVFDDGLKTYIQMPPSMRTSEAPALFVMEDEKDPMLVNYRLKGDYYIVDRLFSRAQLRVGTKNAVDIYRDDQAKPERTASWFGRN